MRALHSPRVALMVALAGAMSTGACGGADTEEEADAAEALPVDAPNPVVSMGVRDPSAPGAFQDDPRDTTSFETSADSTPESAPPNSDASIHTGNGINYDGGPILPYVSVYLIIYGDWLPSTTNIIKDFVESLGGTSYWAINHGYSDNWGNSVGGIKLAGTQHDNYSRGKHLTEDDIRDIVNHSMDEGFPTKDHGLYVVLTARDVTFPDFCSKACGHHSWFSRHTGPPIFGTTTNIKYAVIGNANRCPYTCAAQQTTPNNNIGADSAVSVIAHEAEETATDPLLDAWRNKKYVNNKIEYVENADKCAWTFGKAYFTSNGAMANMAFGGRNWLIQRNWVNANGGYCSRRAP